MPGKSTVHICVVGAGTMGRGIAQVALAAGHAVSLVDKDESQLAAARQEITDRLARRNPDAERLVEAKLTLAVSIADTEAVTGSVAIEAVSENLPVKRAVLGEALAHFGAGAVLATNTSSLSITEIAAGVGAPERVVGMHFFNPVPAMKLVEVVSGLQTDPELVDDVADLATSWGKEVARVRSTPGFIVNRVARPFYGEALRLVEEGAATLQVVDELLTGGGGFRMGPFELMDLIGNDVNHEVTRTVWAAYHYDPRFQPSLLQRELVASGRYGRKTGSGFYSSYEAGRPAPEPAAASGPIPDEVVLHGDSPQLAVLLARAGVSAGRAAGDPALVFPGIGSVVVTRGRTAREESLLRAQPVAVVDRCLDPANATAIAFACESGPLAEALVALLGAAAVRAFPVADTPGLVVARIVSMIINEAWETVQNGVAAASDVDTAMRFGTNYPLGPFAWCERWTPGAVLELLDAIWSDYHDPRYRASRLLRHAARVDRSA